MCQTYFVSCQNLDEVLLFRLMIESLFFNMNAAVAKKKTRLESNMMTISSHEMFKVSKLESSPSVLKLRST